MTEKPKRRNRFEHVCRNGHVRTKENTYIHKNGQRQCKDCPGFQLNRTISSRKRAQLREQRPPDNGPIYHRPLSPEQLAYLRSLIPCQGCGSAFGEPHDGRCPVPFNREAAA